MFEIGIFCVIFLAVAYWAVLWLMGRRQDVLQPPFRQERLESLLNTIKQDLNQPVRK